jgi:hypothetical protein
MNTQAPWYLAVLLCFSASMAAAAQPTGPVVINLMPTFWDVMAAEPATRAQKLEALLKAHPRIHGPVLPTDTDLSQYIENLTPFLAQMRELEPKVLTQIDASRKLLNGLLPPLEATTIYVGPSLFTSNGQVRVVDSRPVLVIGVDVQAYAELELLPAESRHDLRAFIAHELVHTHHYEQNPAIRALANDLFDRASPAPLYVGLWVEGFATCVSMMVDGDGTVERALMSKDLPRLIAPVRGKVARELESKLELRSIDAIAEYFWADGAREDIPSRSGYAIGALVASDIVKRAGLKGAMDLHDEALLREVRAALVRIADPRYELAWKTVCESR